MKNQKRAFTLAEVLLVLAIIGVIAAVTIPAIMQQSSERKFAALARKAQSTLQNAIDLKIASVPIGPGRGGEIFQWLLDGEEDGTNTLKAIKRDSNTNAAVIQTPDGTIFYSYGHLGGGCPVEDPNTILGCVFMIDVDLNGSDGPTKATVEKIDASGGTFGGGIDFYAAKAYDIITLRIEENGQVMACTGTNNPCKRAKKYLGTK